MLWSSYFASFCRDGEEETPSIQRASFPPPRVLLSDELAPSL